MDAICGFVDSGGTAKKFGNIQEFLWFWQHWWLVQYYKNDDLRKFRNQECIFLRCCKHIVEKIHIAEWSSNKVDESKSVRLLGLCGMLGENARSWRCNQKVERSSVNFEDVSHLQRIAWIGRRADWLRVDNFPIGLLHEIQARSATKARHTWNFQWSNNLHVHVQRDWFRKERKWRCLCSYFNDWHKWYQGYATNYGGKWDLRASQLVEKFEDSGHPVFHGMTPLGRRILERKNNRDTIHFNGEYCNVDLLYRTIHSTNQLCIYGAVTKWYGKKLTTNSGGKSEQTWKCSQNTPRNTDQAGRTIFQDFHQLRETECSRSWKTSKRCL